ncbi:TetR/AcrR family transcriptional regulator [Pseudodonghicola xiamenensis]|uniref:TetR family transcriptional regulator n=1 Tax=Pseudodonghicola xiamenensis TaxID=337702 RepID=A0A8J3HAA4_9RHOB|nr:TetR/AcrR family transcriptional regulator [Pseudodonghicola xiamenensis]GHG97151.1 TetR family transcriptional regulator [Pseudodonghicola xiamenensis]
MRMSRQDAAKNRERVVKAASEMFRDSGYDGVGIAALMKAAGLTNGAFYKQFDSKEALIAEATEYALARNAEAWQAVLDQAKDQPLEAIAKWYLSAPHMQHRGLGCTYATLAAEAPRHAPPAREAFDSGIRKTLEQLAEVAPTGSETADDTAAIRLLSRLVGALTLARAVSDPELADRILAANGAVTK